MSTSSATSAAVDIPANFDAEYILPILVVVFVAVNFSHDAKYAWVRSAVSAVLKNPCQFLPETLGLIAVALAVGAGLFLHPEGLRAEASTLEELRARKRHVFELRQLWPTLLNPDSLLIIQQLLVCLSVMLLLARGACARGNGSLTLSLVLLTIAQGVRTYQWMDGVDYLPEGPLGRDIATCYYYYDFATVCAFITLLMLLVAALRSTCSAWLSGCSVFQGTMSLVVILTACSCLARNNYLDGSAARLPDFTFSFFHVVEMCAAPFLVVAACSASQEVDHLGGAFAVLVLAQTMGVWWFLDFGGFLLDPDSPDSVIQSDIKIKAMIKALDRGHFFVLFAAGHAVRTLSAVAACVGYTTLRLSEPVAVKSMPKDDGAQELTGQPVFV